MNLYRFVQEGGTLITEGSTSTLFAEYNLTPGVTVENPPALFARGTILRGVVEDAKSPLAYGFGDRELPVYFSQSPVLNAGGAGALAGFGRGGGAGYSQNTQPMANQPAVSAFPALGSTGAPEASAAGGRGGRGGRGGAGGAALAGGAPDDIAGICGPPLVRFFQGSRLKYCFFRVRHSGQDVLCYLFY